MDKYFLRCCIFPPVFVMLNVYKYSLSPQHMVGLLFPADLKLGSATGHFLANEM